MAEKPSGSRAGLLWFLQAASGMLLVILLGTHMVANHFVVEGGLRTYADVVAYLTNPIILVWEVIFLIIVTFHAMLGVRSVLLDLGPGPGLRRALNLALTVLGILMVTYGIWLTLQIRGQG